MCEESSLPIVTNVENGCEIFPKVSAAIVYAGNAVNIDGKRSAKYYLSQVLQEYIQRKAVLNLDFSNDRFLIKDEEAIRARSRKRRASIS